MQQAGRPDPGFGPLLLSQSASALQRMQPFFITFAAEHFEFFFNAAFVVHGEGMDLFSRFFAMAALMGQTAFPPCPARRLRVRICSSSLSSAVCPVPTRIRSRTPHPEQAVGSTPSTAHPLCSRDFSSPRPAPPFGGFSRYLLIEAHRLYSAGL